VALAARGRQSFQEAEAAVAPCKYSCRADLSLAALPYKSNLLPLCEKIFIARRLAICTAAVLLCVLPLGASDASAPAEPKIEAQASNSATSTSQTQPSAEGKTKKSDKYDIDRIGNRGIGNGVNLYSLQKERALGEAMAAAIDRQAKLVADPDLNDYVNLLGQKLARNSDAEVPFTIKVIDSPELKVFSLPGGFLYVDKGLIMEVESEAELAGLMAHEIAHVAARHVTRSATRKHAWNMISIPLGHLGPAGFGIEQIAPLSLKKFSRDAEIEADLLGLEYMYAAGYDPQAFLEALEKLHSKEAQAHARLAKALPAVNFLAKVPLHNQVAHAFSYYPPIEERIQKAQTEISTFLPSRDDYVVDTSEFQIVKARLAWADRPILRRHRSGDGVTNGPVLRRHPPEGPQSEQVARFVASQPLKDATFRAAVPPSW
jgi:Zn-dependent protease with chaperone function